MKEVDWDDLKLFDIVATEGGLAGAAGRAGLSAPTIGRKMLLLERKIGRTLFIRSQNGYRLAPDGEVLLEKVLTMRQSAAEIAQWHGEAFSLPIVSISSGIWIAGFIAANTAAIRGPSDPFRLCCKQCENEDELTYRRGLISIRHDKPATGNFAVRKSVDVAYCAYRQQDSSGAALTQWISIGTEVAASDAEKWVFRHREPLIHTWTNAPSLLPGLIQGGAGKGVLPCFVGDALPGLVRDGEAIEELSHPLWIVVNDDDRHAAEMRLAIDRLVALLKSNETLFNGRQ
ncbi:LysR family transcriptional regulator [Agrobacterium radiobacter]|uniref:LysR family transcriptional regulator n=1 Tax=Agrobacterium radiobacter TaxID=362 RepID=UPI003F828A96